MVLEFLKVILLGIVEGITEWLPISSTGHMILVDQFVRLNQDQEFIDLFLFVIQLGAILAVVTLFFHRLNPFSPKKSAAEKKSTWQMWFKVAVACIPAVAVVFIDDFLEEHLYNAWVVAAMLIIYGIAFILIEKRNKKPLVNNMEEMTYKTAFLIGMFQLLAAVPGTSRSGATILGAMLLGTSRYVAAEFSFFLAIPVMVGASLLKALKFQGTFGGEQWALLITGMIVAYIVSMLSIKFLMEYVRKHDFTVFGWYRIVVGVLVILYFAISGAAVY